MFLTRPAPDDIDLEQAYDRKLDKVCIGTKTAQMLNFDSSGAVTKETRQSLNEATTLLRRRMPKCIRWRLVATADGKIIRRKASSQCLAEVA